MGDAFYLAAKKWFERIDGGDPEIFDKLPAKLRMQYYYKIADTYGGMNLMSADPKNIRMFGEPLA